MKYVNGLISTARPFNNCFAIMPLLKNLTSLKKIQNCTKWIVSTKCYIHTIHRTTLAISTSTKLLVFVFIASKGLEIYVDTYIV